MPATPEQPAGRGIDIMLVAHTNQGKTTLVRTLLAQDVGEVRDAPDVTTTVVSYALASSPSHGDLRLWDTPGFGDSHQLLRRLTLQPPWFAWLVRELWDRWRHPRLWRGQRLLHDLRARADVVLYLVNLAESPNDAVYVQPELAVLAWTGKPVIAVLNQGGLPGQELHAPQRLAQWRDFLAQSGAVRNTLSLDSYTRCWVQELVLFEEIGKALPAAQQGDYQQLLMLVRQTHQQRFDASIATIADYLLRLAGMRIALPSRWFDSIKDIWTQLRQKIPWGSPAELQPHEAAMARLTEAYLKDSKQLTEKLIAIHGLDGVSASQILKSAHQGFSTRAPIDGATSAVTGGVISGALTGLGADLLVGGLTLGTGALVGAVLGALSIAALAKGYNTYTERDQKEVGWSVDSLNDAFYNAANLYLTVAHYGRGKGPWRPTENPELWGQMVVQAQASHADALKQLWEESREALASTQAREQCTHTLRSVLSELLTRLHPAAQDQIAASTLPEPPR